MIWYSFDKNMDFYQFDLNSNTNTHLGTIQNFVIDDATLQQIGDSLYFSCGTSDDEGKLVSSIYSLNLREGTLNTFQSDLKDISPIIGFARKMNEPTLLALEHQISVPKDYIREYGADGSSKVLLTSPTDVRYVKLWSDAENLYILCRKTSNDTETYYIDIFDWNLQKTNTILFTDQQQTDYFNADINDFMINDQFVYIRNFSNKCLIAKRTNNELVTIHEDELLRPISPQSFESGKQQTRFSEAVITAKAANCYCYQKMVLFLKNSCAITTSIT